VNLTRRDFMVGCSAGIAAMAGGRVGNLVFANQDAPTNGLSISRGEVFVMIFLRGGCDGLSFVVPEDSGGIYATARGPLKVNGALPIDPRNSSFAAQGTGLGLHPSATLLRDLYQSGKVALVHACGLDNDSRSHFDMMDFIERGTPENKNTGSGWLARHIRAVNPDGLLPTVAAGSAIPASLLTDNSATSVGDAANFTIAGPRRYASSDPEQHEMLAALERMYQGNSPLAFTSRRTFSAIRALTAALPSAGAGYPSGGFGDSLKLIARLVKYGELGMQVATVDLGGWDHHENQGVNETFGRYYTLLGTLSQGLHAFYNDLDAAGLAGSVTVAVQTEFGRRLGKNSTAGTDHGHGGVMIVMGGNVNGGKVYGQWPGLEDLDQRQDLKITTDYRNVLSEILIKRLGNPYLAQVFPGLDAQSYQPQGIVANKFSFLDPDFSGGRERHLPLIMR
jgi:uncharacterized protein (DUF1501 family)